MRGRHAAAAMVFAALSIAMTWPLAPNLGRAVSDPGDPYINIWILDWDWYATFHQPLSLFHANAFHPAQYSLAYSENLYGLAVLLFPLRALGVGPVAAYNVAMLAGFAFCGFAAYLLGWRLSGSWIAGVAAGVFYAFLPFRFVHLPHVQHVWGGWLPLMLFALLAYAERPTRKRAILFAAAFLMNGLTNIHYLLFGAVACAITALLALRREHWRELAIATFGACLLLAPFLVPYAIVAKQYGMQRSYEEVLRFSAKAADWLPGQLEPELRLFPGWLAYAVALIALALVRRHKPQAMLALLWIAIGFAGSLGLHFFVHQFLFGGVPGFRAIRVPARWAVIAYIGIAILIALATAALPRKLRWLVPVAFVMHLWVAPIRWYVMDPRPNEVYTWLAKQDVRGVAELPIDSIASDYEYLLRSTAHHKPIVNGISGFAPPLRVELSRLSKETPIPDAFIERLQEAEVDTVIVHFDQLGDRAPVVKEWIAREVARGRLGFIGRFHTHLSGDWVFRVGRGAAPPDMNALYCGPGTMGALDFPPANFHFDEGSAIFSGWTVSPHGIAAVDLWFDNHTERVRATLVPDPRLDARCAGRKVARTRYVAVFDRRPENIRRETDVIVEVTDGRGHVARFDNRWLTWE